METEKTVEEILSYASAEESKVNGTDSRNKRLNCLTKLNSRLEDWLSAFENRSEKGPSLREMDLVVGEIENKLESIKKQDQG